MRYRNHPPQARDPRLAATVGLIHRKIVDASINPKIFRFARDAVRAVPEHDELGEIGALIDAIRARVSYRRDPVGIETIADAHDTLEIGAGDCDDLTVLAGGAFQSLGYPVEIELVGERRLSHVRPIVKTKKYGKVPVDLARPDQKFTSKSPTFPMVYTVPVKSGGNVSLPYGATATRTPSTRRPVLKYGAAAQRPRTLAQMVQAAAANRGSGRATLAEILADRNRQPDPLTEKNSQAWAEKNPFQMIAGVKWIQIPGPGRMIGIERRVRVPGRMLDSRDVQGGELGSWLSDVTEKVVGHDTAKKLEGSVNKMGRTALEGARMIPVVGNIIADVGTKLADSGQSPDKMSWATIQRISATDPTRGAELTAAKQAYEARKLVKQQGKQAAKLTAAQAAKAGLTPAAYKAAVAGGQIAPIIGAGSVPMGADAAKKSSVLPLLGLAALAYKFL